MLVEKLFFENPESKQLLYVLHYRIFDKTDFQISIDNLKQSINSMFNLVYLDTTLLKDRLSDDNKFKIIGPIKTFKSVFCAALHLLSPATNKYVSIFLLVTISG